MTNDMDGRLTNSSSLSRFDRILGRVITFFGIVAGILFMTMALIVSYNVLMRYFLGKPPVWAIETTEYILVYATFFAAAWILRKDGHVKIDILVICLSPRTQHILRIVVAILGMGVCGLLAWYGIKATYSLYVRDVIMMGMIPISKWILIGSIPLGIILTLLQFILMFLELIRGKTVS